MRKTCDGSAFKLFLSLFDIGIIPCVGLTGRRAGESWLHTPGSHPYVFLFALKLCMCNEVPRSLLGGFLSTPLSLEEFYERAISPLFSLASYSLKCYNRVSRKIYIFSIIIDSLLKYFFSLSLFLCKIMTGNRGFPLLQFN